MARDPKTRAGGRTSRRLALLVLAVVAVLGAGLARILVSASVPSTPVRIDAARLMADLRVLAADDMEGREFGTAGGARARAFVVRRFRESGLQAFDGGYLQPVSAQVGPRHEMRTGANVIGYLAGTGDSPRYIVVSAHYDHIGVRNGRVFNGADDNASGTAALFALAAYFQAHRPATSILFAAFDGEEEGLLGSRVFVHAPPVDAADLLIDLNADMIGREPRNRLFVVGTYTQPALKPLIARVASGAAVKLIFGHDDPSGRSGEDWTRDSDHYAFMQAGIPALYFGVEDYAQHHQPTDEAATITTDFYVRAVETLLDIVEACDADTGALIRARGHRGA